MNDAVVIESLDQLRKYLNEKGVMEIALRRENSQFASFQKILINDLSQVKEKAALEQTVKLLNKNTMLNERNLKLISQVANIQKIGLLVNGLSLCATCAGFMIMYKKLNDLSSEIGRQIDLLHNTVKQGNDVNSIYEFNKVLSDHMDMLDCRKKKQPYSEEKMRELVDNEYNVLTLLVEIFHKDISTDQGKIIYSIFSLLSMFTVSLRYFDEVYYVNNHENLESGNVWHISHDKWTGIYETLSSKWFVEKLQDYAIFDTTLNTLDVDTYYISLMDQVYEQKEEIEDNQNLIVALGDITLMDAFREMTNKEVKETISAAFAKACKDAPAEDVKTVYNNALKQMALA